MPLERALGTQIGSVMADLHRDHGVDVRLGVGVDGLEGTDHVSGVRLADGVVIPAEVVVVGVGVAPNTAWLEGSGLNIDDGVVCDDTLSAAPGVVAAGDIARWPSARYGQYLRVEHWETAVQMGEAAALRLLADRAGHRARDGSTRCRGSGATSTTARSSWPGGRAPDDQVEVVIGSLEERRFVALYGRDDRLAGVLGMNRPAHVARLRPLVERGASLVRGAGRRGGAGMSLSVPSTELVDQLDEDGAVVGAVTRRDMRAHNLRHRSVAVVVVNSRQELLVHRRADWKDVWPSRWDLAFGGVVGAGEAWEEAARRELAEEAGVARPARVPGRGHLRRRRGPRGGPGVPGPQRRPLHPRRRRGQRHGLGAAGRLCRVGRPPAVPRHRRPGPAPPRRPLTAGPPSRLTRLATASSMSEATASRMSRRGHARPGPAMRPGR